MQVWEVADALQPTFATIDRLVASNLQRVQRAFAAAQVGPHHFAGSTGYGHGDLGREALDRVSHKSSKKHVWHVRCSSSHDLCHGDC